MHTLSSDRRTCMASASAVECTATVAIPSSLQARRMRRAISPRLAMRILSNMVPQRGEWRVANGEWSYTATIRHAPFATRSFNDDQRFAELDRLAVLDQDLRHGAGAGRGDLVHRLHGFDDQKRLADRDLGADLDERFCAGLRRPIGGPDHRRGHRARMLRQV